MEVALRRRLAGVADVSISQSEQKAVVTFVPGTHTFSAAEFRHAVAEADVDVVSFEVDVCGSVQAERFVRVTIDGSPPLAINRHGTDRADSVCLSGRLDDRVTPPELHVIEGR